MSGTFQHFDNRLRFSLAGYMRFNDQVNEFRQRYGNVWIHCASFLVLAQKLSIFMCTRIPCLSDGCPNDFFTRVEVQAFDALVKVWSGATKVIAKTLKGDTKQDAGRPWRIVQNLLGFVVRSLDHFWHVIGCRDAAWLRPNEFPFFKKAICTALRALSHAEVSPVNRLGEVPKADLLVVQRDFKVYDAYVRNDIAYDRKGIVLAKGLAMGTSER